MRATAVTLASVRPEHPDLPSSLRALAHDAAARSPRGPSRLLAALAEHLNVPVLLALVMGPDHRLHLADAAGRALRLPFDWSVAVTGAWEPHLQRVLPRRPGETLMQAPLAPEDVAAGLLIAYAADPPDIASLASAALVWRKTFTPLAGLQPSAVNKPMLGWLTWAAAVSTQLGHLLEVESTALDLLLRHAQLDSDSSLVAALAGNQQALHTLREDLVELTRQDGTASRFTPLSLSRVVRTAVDHVRRSPGGTQVTLPHTPGRPDAVQVLGEAVALRRLLEIVLLQSVHTVKRLRVEVATTEITAAVRIRALPASGMPPQVTNGVPSSAVALGTALAIATLHQGHLIEAPRADILWELSLPRWNGVMAPRNRRRS